MNEESLYNITKKQNEILIWLYKFRFLSRLHIQTLLKHRDTKRINEWLKDLTNKEIIGRHYEIKKNEKNKAAIYFLMIKSREYLIDKDNINQRVLKRTYSDKDRSQRLINHSLLIADFYLKTQEEKDSVFLTSAELNNYLYLPTKTPDAYILKNKKRYFFEVIDSGIPKFAIKNKINNYLEYFDEKTWQNNMKHEFPTILLFSEDEVIKRYIIKYLKENLDEDINFCVSGKNWKWESVKKARD